MTKQSHTRPACGQQGRSRCKCSSSVVCGGAGVSLSETIVDEAREVPSKAQPAIDLHGTFSSRKFGLFAKYTKMFCACMQSSLELDSKFGSFYKEIFEQGSQRA